MAASTAPTLHFAQQAIYQRFEGFGTPPNKQGDCAYLLHIIRSLKSTGRAACKAWRRRC